eukprot:scaffold195069_cov27-Tisochrysis_lutea.AAC.2
MTRHAASARPPARSTRLVGATRSKGKSSPSPSSASPFSADIATPTLLAPPGTSTGPSPTVAPGAVDGLAASLACTASAEMRQLDTPSAEASARRSADTSGEPSSSQPATSTLTSTSCVAGGVPSSMDGGAVPSADVRAARRGGTSSSAARRASPRWTERRTVTLTSTPSAVSASSSAARCALTTHSRVSAA